MEERLERSKMKNTKILVVVLIILLLLSIGYIFYELFDKSNNNKATDLSATINSSFANGTRYGVESLVLYLNQEEVFPKITFYNGTTLDFDLIKLEEKCAVFNEKESK